MKKFLSAIILRFLPTLQPPAVMTDARESMRKAWEAVSNRIPTELPVFTLPKLPALSLPKLAMPEMPEMPAMPSMAALGRFLSGLTISSLVFAPGQIQGIAAFCHFAAGDLAPQPETPRIEQTTPSVTPRAVLVDARVLAGSWAAVGAKSPATPRTTVSDVTVAANALPPAAPAPRPTLAAALPWPEPVAEFSSEQWSSARERGQRPPPMGV